jgi:two-component system OmpR family sensor kinase
VSDIEFVSPPTTPPQAPAGSSSAPEEALPGPEGEPRRRLSHPGRRRLWLRSLQSRLVAGAVALVLVLVGAIGTSTYFALRSFLGNRLDQQLTSTAGGSLQRLFYGQDSAAPALRTQDVWAVLLAPDGELLTYPDDDSGVTGLRLSDLDRKRLAAAGSAKPMTVRTTAGEELRVVPRAASIRTFAGEAESAVAVIGISTAEEHRTLRRLVSAELLIGAGAVLLAFFATTLGVRRSLRNLYAVTGTAREVAAELSPTGTGLDRRVPVVEEGTEVGQLAESMNTLLAAVETQFGARLESEQRMRQFLADASHELRTPLTSIRGYAELARMQRSAGGDASSNHADNLDRIESEGTRMSRLVDDLLLLARGDADDANLAMQRDVLDVAEVLDDAVSGSRAAFPEREIRLERTWMPAVLGDRDQLLRVVRNLVNNAAVHTDRHRPILVRGFADAGGAVVTVADGGPGLPAEEAAHVFERFWRADKARTRARGGSGLGLSIVATIVRAHGGSVRFDSTVEGGSTVTVWLPATG